MRIAWLLLIVSVGCKQRDPLYCGKHPEDPRCNDGGVPIDNDGDNGIDARLNYGSGNYEINLTKGPTGPVPLTGPIDTTAYDDCLNERVWVRPEQPGACFVVGTTITISDVAVTGNRPLVLIASDSITIAGTLDVAGHVGTGIGGPGVPGGPCVDGTEPVMGTDGGGGGAGGSFMLAGGNGGAGNGPTPNAGGIASNMDAMPPAVLRAGCTGQRGAAGNGAVRAVAGPGGGAVYVVAGNRIDLATAIINASGGGGASAINRGGGAGGGSGGMIVLSAPMISSTAQTRLVANGGSGAAGANGGAGGSDPDPLDPSMPANGGATGGCSSATGGSGYPAVSGGGTGAGNCGGGGGGGAAGFIATSVALTNGEFSPMPAAL